jgi:hypothetical protein
LIVIILDYDTVFALPLAIREFFAAFHFLEILIILVVIWESDLAHLSGYRLLKETVIAFQLAVVSAYDGSAEDQQRS